MVAGEWKVKSGCLVDHDLNEMQIRHQNAAKTLIL
jgi:hypothetical protein